MELQLPICLDIVTLDPTIALRAHRPIELVVMPAAIRTVAQDVKVHGLERLPACLAYETVLVPAPCQASVGRAD